MLTATGIHLYALSYFWNHVLVRMSAAARIPVRWAIPLTRIVVVFSWIWAWLLCGLRPGMLRPWVVVFIRQGAIAGGFRWRAWAPLAIALTIDAAWGVFCGEELFRSDRIFYGLAVGGAILVLENSSGLKAHFLLSLSSWVFTAIWEIFQGGLLALATPILSFLMIPIFGMLLYPLLFVLSLGPVFDGDVFGLSRESFIGSGLLVWAETGLFEAAAWTMRLQGVWSVSIRALIFGLFLLALTLVLRQRKRLRFFVLILILTFRGIYFLARGSFDGATASQLQAPHAPNADEVIQLDVGQGDAALILDSSGAGMIDTGSFYSLNDTKWAETLARLGVSRLNWVALTHLDEDHAGGLLRLVRLIRIGCVATSAAELETERGKAYARRLERFGVFIRDWDSGCVAYPTRRPPQSQRTRDKPNGRMSAILVPLSFGAYYLSAGDADSGDELPIIRWANDWIATHSSSPSSQRALRSDHEDSFVRILKISHHGSRTSTDARALQAFRPEVAIISAGFGNSHGHPTHEVLDRLEKNSVRVYRTDRDGAVRATSVRRPPPARRQ